MDHQAHRWTSRSFGCLARVVPRRHLQTTSDSFHTLSPKILAEFKTLRRLGELARLVLLV